MLRMASIAIVGAVGLAVDGSHYYDMRRKHATVINSALLAGARHLAINPGDTSGTIAAAKKFYDGNLPTTSSLLDNSIAFVIADSGQSVTFTGTATISTTFMNLFGFEKLDITEPAKAGLAQGSNSASNLEIAVMLDVTGSTLRRRHGPVHGRGRRRSTASRRPRASSRTSCSGRPRPATRPAWPSCPSPTRCAST